MGKGVSQMEKKSGMRSVCMIRFAPDARSLHKTGEGESFTKYCNRKAISCNYTARICSPEICKQRLR